MHELVVIEDSTIATMAKDPRFSGIPCVTNQPLLTLTSATSSCGSCARKKLETQRAALSKAKSCLANLSLEKKNELKSLLNAKLVRVIFKSATGQVSTVTF